MNRPIARTTAVLAALAAVAAAPATRPANLPTTGPATRPTTQPVEFEVSEQELDAQYHGASGWHPSVRRAVLALPRYGLQAKPGAPDWVHDAVARHRAIRVHSVIRAAEVRRSFGPDPAAERWAARFADPLSVPPDRQPGTPASAPSTIADYLEPVRLRGDDR